MRSGFVSLLCSVVAAGVSVAAAGAEQADQPLVVNGNLSLTTRDFDAYMEKVPPNLRYEFRTDAKRVNTTIDGLWVRRVLAQRARDEGLDKDPIVAARIRQAEEDTLSGIYISRIGRNMKFPDLEPRAREIYKANPKAFIVPEAVKIEHILISAKKYSGDDLVRRANEAYQQAKGAKDFLEVAARYSDDERPQSGGKVGDLPPGPPTQFEHPIPDELAKLKPGDVSKPIKTIYGMHIIKLVERRPQRQKSFDEVKDDLIAAEKGKLVDEAKNEVIDAVRADPKTHLNLENVQALKTEFKPPEGEAPPSNIKPVAPH